MTVRVLVPLADGAEEMETVIVVDVLRRAGMNVVMAGVDGADAVTCSRNVRLVPDCALANVTADEFDLIVLPGGAKGAETLATSPIVQAVLRRHAEAGRTIGAICAAPIALVAAGIGRGGTLTSHPAVRSRVEAHGHYSESRVVRDGPIVTSRGPGTAIEFALALIEDMLGPAKAAEVAAPMLVATDS